MTSSRTDRAGSSATVAGLDALYRGFADGTRIRILNVLAAGELCVCDVVGLLRLPQPTISRHLAYLRRTGLVEGRRGWKFSHYRLAAPRHPLHRNLIGCVRSCFAGIPSLDRERRAAARRVAERRAEAADSSPSRRPE